MPGCRRACRAYSYVHFHLRHRLDGRRPRRDSGDGSGLRCRRRRWRAAGDRLGSPAGRTREPHGGRESTSAARHGQRRDGGPGCARLGGQRSGRSEAGRLNRDAFQAVRVCRRFCRRSRSARQSPRRTGRRILRSCDAPRDRRCCVRRAGPPDASSPPAAPGHDTTSESIRPSASLARGVSAMQECTAHPPGRGGPASQRNVVPTAPPGPRLIGRLGAADSPNVRAGGSSAGKPRAGDSPGGTVGGPWIPAAWGWTGKCRDASCLMWCLLAMLPRGFPILRGGWRGSASAGRRCGRLDVLLKLRLPWLSALCFSLLSQCSAV